MNEAFVVLHKLYLLVELQSKCEISREYKIVETFHDMTILNSSTSFLFREVRLFLRDKRPLFHKPLRTLIYFQ